MMISNGRTSLSLGKDEVQTSCMDFSHTPNGYLRIVFYSVRKVKIYASYLAFIGMGNREQLHFYRVFGLRGIVIVQNVVAY